MEQLQYRFLHLHKSNHPELFLYQRFPRDMPPGDTFRYTVIRSAIPRPVLRKTHGPENNLAVCCSNLNDPLLAVISDDVPLLDSNKGHMLWWLGNMLTEFDKLFFDTKQWLIGPILYGTSWIVNFSSGLFQCLSTVIYLQRVFYNKTENMLNL